MKLQPEYLPPRLVEGSQRWYINAYAPDRYGIRQRYRLTFDLNRIHNIRQRRERADRIIRKLTYWLENGRPIDQFRESKVTDQMIDAALKLKESTIEVGEALQRVLRLKERTGRPMSLKTYQSVAGLFLDWLHENEEQELQIGQVTHYHARRYLDHCLLERGVSAQTHNNNLRSLRTLFNELKDRGYLLENPFAGIKLLKVTQKRRRTFTEQEARTVIRYIQREEPLLLIALLLQYCCFIRPAELRRLRIADFNLRAGLVYISCQASKTGRERTATIPNSFLQHFDPNFFGQYPDHFFLFGEGFAPAPGRPCGPNEMGRRHKRALERLQKEGSLDSIEGLTWYSWKDTGITDALEEIPLVAVQDQAGHARPEMTLRYRHPGRINQQIRKQFKNKIL